MSEERSGGCSRKIILKSIVDKETLRNRKRISRNSESTVTNSVIYTLIIKAGASVTFRKSKRTKQTIKMLLPETIVLNNTVYDQSSIAKLNSQFMKETLSEEPVSVDNMNNKQYNRTREAQICNGLLYLLRSSGYSFTIRKTKRAKLTEQLVKISSIILTSGETVPMERLIEIGIAFQSAVDNLFGRNQTVLINSNTLSEYEIPSLEQCVSKPNTSNQYTSK
ncbi:hypothetical protein EHI8A_062450 [Entamoeba histolytica HM-1:IMSS-B]|uniref:Uncharacterized protein n=6 Tax=Entamoeba histolytica TaxID=5759 RepID=C4M6V9_ENTH1|nr:hypothetical protein EHI_139300 [Entamoeba histolytica HM-1:IMSS]EMD46347.1 Hypothetical protein EHI5A_101970 [Entamoeba histolytica KU27]EMH73019.1 hypothetical protein EHI8A_062450 [Entamoeba histolytica HM-1:IMSS-B]EMS11676.1 hypothetical protein KM1_119250 [Entamoeba histolytica HM-3:IMSS]ENY63899.1 hypothetical protein EHI7A_065010 [Entamoeba histolytica HM-1:IMSS-A]GAT97239.1 hypothetical protein CL6EHI_139300 [Entamoeba histolytica]|eukprot:XP_651321.1 hypothetical protein EHI_139300 [Entamoeba histolytica HM-1:IMSS]